MAEDFARADAESGRVEAVDEAGLARLVGEEGRWDYLVNTLPGSVGYRLPPSCDALLRQHTPVVRTLSSFAQEKPSKALRLWVVLSACMCWCAGAGGGVYPTPDGAGAAGTGGQLSRRGPPPLPRSPSATPSRPRGLKNQTGRERAHEEADVGAWCACVRRRGWSCCSSRAARSARCGPAHRRPLDRPSQVRLLPPACLCKKQRLPAPRLSSWNEIGGRWPGAGTP